MIPMVQRDDAAAYVLGAIGAAEAQTFERLMAADSALRNEVTSLREVAALLAYAAPIAQPPEALRSKILRLGAVLSEESLGGRGGPRDARRAPA